MRARSRTRRPRSGAPERRRLPLRSVLDHAPVLARSTAPGTAVGWANAAYRERFDAPGPDALDHRDPNAFGHVLEEVP